MNQSKVSLLLIFLLLISSTGYCITNEYKSTNDKTVKRIKVLRSFKLVTTPKNLELKKSNANKLIIGKRIIKFRKYGSQTENSNRKLINGSNTDGSQDVNSSIIIFPQPANEQITVNCYSNNNTLSWVKIFSVDGRCLIEKVISVKEGKNQFQLDISSLSRGVYTCLINSGFRLIHSKLEVY
jgi:hypothetical protein